MPPSTPVPGLAYAHLNLRRNPFGGLTEDERVALADVDVEDALRWLATPLAAVQFIGGKGRGKTTHLLALRARLPSCAYVHIPEGETAPVPAGSPILVDEAQRLTLGQRLRLFHCGIPLVLGTHRDFERELARAGRTVRTIDVTSTMTVERLHRLLNARIIRARRAGGPVPTITMTAARRLHRDSDGDIRGMLGRLYEIFETLPTPRDVDVDSRELRG